MPEPRNTVDRMLALVCVVATLAALLVSAFAALGLINGVTTAAAAAEQAGGILTPAAYGFSIWALIFAGLLAFTIYQLMPGKLERFRPIRLLYVLSCILYSGWLYSWHQGFTSWSLAIIVFLWLSLVLIETRRGCGTFTETLVVQAPFGLFFGWVTALIMMHIGILLTAVGDRVASIAACLVIVATTILAVLARIKLGNFFFPLAIAWALTAIAIRQGSNTPIVVAAAFGVVICLVTTGSFVVNLRDSTSE